MSRLLTAITGLGLCGGVAFGSIAGPISVGAPSNLLEQIGVDDGELFIPTIEFGDDQVRVSFPMDGVEHELVLHSVSFRADSFQVWSAQEGGVLAPVEVDDPKTYQGRVVGLADSHVAASIIDGEITATILLDTNTWAIQPVGMGGHASYNAGDVVAVDAFCGVDERFDLDDLLDAGDEHDAIAFGEVCIPAGLTAFDADHEFYQWSGGSAQATVDQIELIMNATNVIYQRDIPMSHLFGDMIIRATPDDPYSGDIFNRLDQMLAHWNSQQQGIDRVVAHLFSGGDWSGVIGLAYLGVPCRRADLSYGVSISNFSNNMLLRVGLTAHELGHNWGSNHCDGSDCYIMCPGIGGCGNNVEKFGPFAQNAIFGFVSSIQTCLDEECVDGSPPSSGVVFGNTLSGEIGSLDANGGFVPGVIPDFDVDGMAYDRNRSTFFMTDTRDGATLFSMRQLDFRIREIGPIVGASRIAGLAFDPNTDRLYGIDQAIGQLYLIEPEEDDGVIIAVATPIGEANGGLMGALGFDEDQSILYGIDDFGGSMLYTIDTETGEWEEVGDTLLDDCDGLCWRPADQTLYTIDGRSQALYTLDADTGESELQTEFRNFGIGSTFGMAVGDERCLADIDEDGELDADDFFGYLDLFANGDSRADLTGSGDPDDPQYGVPDGEIDADDFFFFLDAFSLGCG